MQYGSAFVPPSDSRINTGITATVKQVDMTGPSLQAKTVVVMPQRESWTQWGDSTPVHVKLIQGGEYKLKVSDYYNMSYLTSNYNFRGGTGVGGDTILNRANIGGIMLRRMTD